MPPRYAYWTILIGDEPTAFRSGSQEDLMPTFKRLKEKQPSARMMWFQNGKLWQSRLDAQEAMRARGEIGRRSDPRQDDRRRPFRPTRPRPSERAPGPRERREERDPSGKLAWKPKSQVPSPKSPEKRKWIPKEEYKRSQAPSPKSQVPRDKNWRPGGEHKDPRQKYKDAKKAKWGRFKQTIRKRWESKQSGKKKNE